MSKEKLNGETAKELGTAYQIARYMLKNKPDSRDDDMLLFFYVEKYCRQQRLPMPSYSTISRARRKIQNTEGLFKPSKKAKERRKRKQEAFREAFSSLAVANEKSG